MGINGVVLNEGFGVGVEVVEIIDGGCVFVEFGKDVVCDGIKGGFGVEVGVVGGEGEDSVLVFFGGRKFGGFEYGDDGLGESVVVCGGWCGEDGVVGIVDDEVDFVLV